MFQLAISIFCISLYSTQTPNSSANISTSTQDEIGEHFKSVKEQVEHRWKVFQENREFNHFETGKSDAVLEEEFEEIRKTRAFIWTTEGYDVAENLILNDLVRAAGCIAFSFNNTVPNYNASTMYLGGKNYIACEGPRSKDIPNFFNLLTTHQVTHLVRLTDAYEGNTKKCHPYWNRRLTESSDGTNLLNIPTETNVYSIRTYDLAYWRDNQGVDPKKLLALVLKVRQELKNTNSLLVVHCSAGVGRTGTFLAALAIVDAIDRGTCFSIEEIVYRLSLQRVKSVGKFCQYIILHRLAENYLNQKS